MSDTEQATTSSASNSGKQAVRSLNIKPFVKHSDHNENAVAWQRYKRNVERQFRFFGITEATKKKDGLLIYGGDDLIDIDEAIPDPEKTDDDNDYTLLIKKLDDHFLPKHNKDFARFQLNELKQNDQERLADYYARIRQVTKKCDYGTHETGAIRDHLIRTMLNDKLRAKAIRENLTLDSILTEGALDEQTTVQAHTMTKSLEDKQPQSVHAISSKAMHRGSPNRNNDICGRCGYPATHSKCPAQGATCNHCNRPNHFAKMCKSRLVNPTQTRENNRYFSSQHDRKPWNQRNAQYANQPTRTLRNSRFPRPRARHVESNEVDDNDSDSSSNEFDKHIQSRHITAQGKTRNDNNEFTSDNANDDEQILTTHHTGSKYSKKLCTIQVNGINVEAEPDTGSDANIMNEQQFSQLQKQAPDIQLQSTRIKLKALQHELPVIGEVNVNMSNQSRNISTTIVIIKGTIDSPSLIGRQTLEDLGMLLIDNTGNLKSNKEIKNIKENKHQADLDSILNKHQQRFTGIGKAMRDGKEIQIHIPMKDNAIPIAQKPRRVPYIFTHRSPKETTR